MTMEATELAAVHRSVSVPLPVEKAFQLFTDGTGTWWPFASHSIGGDEAVDAVFEGREGGLVYEVLRDGTRAEWADIVAWDPPHRFLLSWRVNPAREPTEVEVRFEQEGEGTRVELEHRGWERVTDGPAEMRASYDTGWEHVLGEFAEAAA
jgi:uncharacterized protein YndB with AHSA1/START domain